MGASVRGGETDEGTASAGIEMRCALSHQIRSPQEAIGTGGNFGGFGGEAIVGFARTTGVHCKIVAEPSQR